MIFVFGCDGYIGNALTQRLLAEGNEVIGFDNFWRREWIEGMGSMSATPLLDMDEKAALFNELYSGTFSWVRWLARTMAVLRPAPPNPI